MVFSCQKLRQGLLNNSYFQIRAKQEQLLKVRNFLPPQAQEPEIFLLDKLIQDGIDIKESTAPSSAGSGRFDCK